MPFLSPCRSLSPDGKASKKVANGSAFHIGERGVGTAHHNSFAVQRHPIGPPSPKPTPTTPSPPKPPPRQACLPTRMNCPRPIPAKPTPPRAHGWPTNCSNACLASG